MHAGQKPTFTLTLEDPALTRLRHTDTPGRLSALQRGGSRSYRNALPDSNDTAAITLILSPENLKKDRLHIKPITTESGAKVRSPFHEIVEIVKLLQGGEAQNQLVLGDWCWSLMKKERNAS